VDPGHLVEVVVVVWAQNSPGKVVQLKLLSMKRVYLWAVVDVVLHDSKKVLILISWSKGVQQAAMVWVA
jgi:hypothetical protein